MCRRCQQKFTMNGPWTLTDGMKPLDTNDHGIIHENDSPDTFECDQDEDPRDQEDKTPWHLMKPDGRL